MATAFPLIRDVDATRRGSRDLSPIRSFVVAGLLLSGCFQSKLGGTCEEGCGPYVCLNGICAPKASVEMTGTDVGSLSTSSSLMSAADATGGANATDQTGNTPGASSSTGQNMDIGETTDQASTAVSTMTTSATATISTGSEGTGETVGEATSCGDNELQDSEDCDFVTSAAVDHGGLPNPYLYCEDCKCFGIMKVKEYYQPSKDDPSCSENFPGRCVNVLKDPAACGDCDTTCKPWETCDDGYCK